MGRSNRRINGVPVDECGQGYCHYCDKGDQKIVDLVVPKDIDLTTDSGELFEEGCPACIADLLGDVSGSVSDIVRETDGHARRGMPSSSIIYGGSLPPQISGGHADAA